jgi:hypothetical protein
VLMLINGGFSEGGRHAGRSHGCGFPSARTEALRERAIVRLTAGQEDDEETPFSIRTCVYLRVAPAARTANNLLLLPPFPPLRNDAP